MTDIFLYAMPIVGPNDIIVRDQTRPWTDYGITTIGGRIEGGRKRKRQPVPGEEGEIIAKTLFANLTEKYGAHTGEYIYWRMVEERKGPFQPGAKYAGNKRH